MSVEAANNLGLFSKLKLNVDDKTGKLTGASDVFAEAIEETYKTNLKIAERKGAEKDTVDKKLEALSNLQMKVTELKAISKLLFHSDAMGRCGVFANMYANYATDTGVSYDTIMDPINMDASCSLQEFTLKVSQVATHDFTKATVGGITDKTSNLNWTGDIVINGQTLAVTSGMCLNDVTTLINSVSGTTNVKANIIQVSANDFRLSLQATTFAAPIAISNNIVGATAGQIPATSGNTIDQLSAKFTFDGIDMVRTTNTISDIVTGLTLDLKKADPATTISVSVKPDTAETKEAIRLWVKTINDLIDEVEKNRKYDPETMAVSEDAILYGTDIIQTLDSAIKNNMAHLVTGVGSGNYMLLEQIGISTDLQTGKMSIDEQVLDESLRSNFDGVRKLFEYQNEISNTNFLVGGHPATIPSNIITDSAGAQLTSTVSLNRDASGFLTATITISGGDYAATTFTVPSDKITVSADGDTVSFLGENAANIGGVTPYKSFEFVYVGASIIPNSGSDSTTLKFTQGYADRIGKNLDRLLDTANGEFARQKTIFADKIKSIDAAVEKITQKAEKEKAKLQKDFARLEAFRQSLAPIQGLLEAIMASSKK